MHAAYIRAVYVGAIGRENVRVTDFSIDRLLVVVIAVQYMWMRYGARWGWYGRRVMKMYRE